MEHIHETASQIRERLLEQAKSQPEPTPRNSKCAACGDTGYIQAGNAVCRCECQKRKIIQAKLDEIPERYREASFANYVPMDIKEQTARDRIAGDFTGSFFLYGDYARGKTHLAIAQYVKLVQIERPCLFFSMAELLSELRQAEFKPGESDPDYFCLVRQRVRYADRFHLFVDDIDKFKITEFKFEVLFDLFDGIWKRKLGLTVTSNYSLTELARGDKVHPAIVRRLDDICTALEV